MRAIVSPRLLLVLAVATLLAGMIASLTVGPRGGSAGAPGTGGPAPSCVVGTGLIANGSFEFGSPAVQPGRITQNYVPDGWTTLGVTDVSRSLSGLYGLPTFDGAVVLDAGASSISQSIGVSLLPGTILTLRFAEHPNYRVGSVSFGDSLSRWRGVGSGLAPSR